MGRFDALTQIEEKPQKPTPLPAALSSAPQKKTVPTIKTDKEEKKPENLKSRKPENNSLSNGLTDKPEKYSTLLEASLIKKSPSGDLTFDGVQNTYLISPVLGSYASP